MQISFNSSQYLNEMLKYSMEVSALDSVSKMLLRTSELLRIILPEFTSDFIYDICLIQKNHILIASNHHDQPMIIINAQPGDNSNSMIAPGAGTIIDPVNFSFTEISPGAAVFINGEIKCSRTDIDESFFNNFPYICRFLGNPVKGAIYCAVVREQGSSSPGFIQVIDKSGEADSDELMKVMAMTASILNLALVKTTGSINRNESPADNDTSSSEKEIPIMSVESVRDEKSKQNILTITGVNKSFAAITGYRGDYKTLAGLPLAVLSDKLKEEPAKIAELIQKNGMPFRSNHLHSYKGVNYELFCYPADQHKLNFTLTEAGQSSETVNKEDENGLKYKALLETSHEGIILIAPDGKFNFANLRCAELLGYNHADELKGTNVFDFLTEADKREILKFIPLLINGEKVSYYKTKIKRRDNTFFDAAVNISLLKNRKDDPLYFMIVIRDITSESEMMATIRKITSFKELMLSLAVEFNNILIENYDYFLGIALQVIGEFTGVDRAYIFDYNHHDKTISSTHEWCRDGIISYKEQLQNINMSAISPLVFPHLEGLMIDSGDVLLMDKDDPVRQHLEKEGIRNLLTLPLMYEGFCTGCIGFDSVTSYRNWDEEEINILKFVAQLVSNSKEKNRREKELRAEISRRSAIMNGSLDGIAVIDCNHKVIEANRQFCDMLGYTKEEISSLHTWDFEALCSREEIISTFSEILDVNMIVESRHRRKDGTEYDAEVSISGAIVGDEPVLITSTRDISARKKAELTADIQYNLAETLVQVKSIEMLMLKVYSELSGTLPVEKIQLAEYNPKDDTFILTFDSSVNPHAGKITDDTALFSREVAAAGVPLISSGGDIFSLSSIMKKEMGEKPSFNRTGLPVFAGDFLTGVLILHNRPQINYTVEDLDMLIIISNQIGLFLEKKRSEKKVQTLLAAVTNNPAMIAIADSSGKIEYANTKFSEVTGYSETESLNLSLRDLLNCDDDHRFLMDIRENTPAGSAWEEEIIRKKKNGDSFWQKTSVTPVFSDKNEISNYIIIMEDVTQRKELVEQIILAKEKAFEINRIKNSFFSNMSHELRTPLIGILGYAELLAEELNENDEFREMIKVILNSGTRLKDTLDYILTMAKLESSAEALKAECVNIVPKLREVFSLYSATAALKGLKYTFEQTSDEVICCIDMNYFPNIINNIVNNALKFTEKGQVNISVNSENNYAVIRISDSGQGIKPEHIPLIWEEFRQVSEGYERTHEGTGLGLPIAKRYTELMGGKIEVESEPGTGTTFIVSFPQKNSRSSVEGIASPEMQAMKSDEDEKGDSLSGKKILYVEDDHFATTFADLILKNEYDMSYAVNSEEALITIERRKFDLILMDINLGRGMDGMKLAKIIKSKKGYENVPVIAISSYDYDQFENNPQNPVVDSYIKKPFQRAALLRLIDKYLKAPDM
ncbi:MAG: PAS domain S-box protein [Ignavibacteriaceae bacterium]|nr:PAS domain S-box protein [Ignavibacteriaceae bacterium]